MKTTKQIDSKSSLLVILFVLVIYPLDAQAYFIGGLGAFLLEIIAIIITFIVFYAKKKFKGKTAEKETNDKNQSKES